MRKLAGTRFCNSFLPDRFWQLPYHSSAGARTLFLSPSQVGAIIAAIIFIGVNYYGTKETGRLQIIIVVILVTLLAVFTIVGLF